MLGCGYIAAPRLGFDFLGIPETPGKNFCSVFRLSLERKTVTPLGGAVLVSIFTFDYHE